MNLAGQLSFARRILVAIALTLGFVLLVATASSTMFALAYWLHRSPQMGEARPLEVLPAAVGICMWVLVLPLLRRIQIPGARLQAKDHPELFELLARLAQAANVEMPNEVILTIDMNAGMWLKGGFLTGRKTAIVMGLPLVHILTISEFEAVVSHEFAHARNGDHRLGALVSQVGGAIRRSTMPPAFFLGSLFAWYHRFFLRVTDEISRAQEFAADRMAAQIAGSDSFRNAMEQMVSCTNLSMDYYADDVTPLVEAGYIPPLTEGLASVFASPSSANSMKVALEEEVDSSAGHPLDAHPPLRDRLAAIKNLPPCKTPDNRSALLLLKNLPALELEIVASCRGVKKEELKPISWAEAESIASQSRLARRPAETTVVESVKCLRRRKREDSQARLN